MQIFRKTHTQECNKSPIPEPRASESYAHNEDPLDEWQAEPRDGSVAARCRGGQAEGQEKANPVEQKRHCEREQTESRQFTGESHRQQGCNVLIKEKVRRSNTYWRRSARRCRHCRSATGQRPQSRLWPQSRHPVYRVTARLPLTMTLII